MNDSIPCLLDTNAIVKYYHTEVGSNIVQYLFDKSPSAQINIINLHIPEVVSVFHKLHAKSLITGQARDAAIDTFLKDVSNERILPYTCDGDDFDEIHNNFYTVYKIPPPVKKKRYFQFLGGWISELKDIADTLDVGMLTIMREIKDSIGESYLFSSDGHVIKIAEAMGLPILNPERMSYDDIPTSINKRRSPRKKINLKVKCQEPETFTTILSTNTIDLCFSGACINYNKKVDVGKKIVLKISDHKDKHSEATQDAEVVWAELGRRKIGVRFIEPITAARFYV